TLRVTQHTIAWQPAVLGRTIPGCYIARALDQQTGLSSVSRRGKERRPTMRVKRPWHVTGKVLVVIAAIAIVASQLIGTTAKAADPIKVGWVGPLSPPGGCAEGALIKQAAEIAAGGTNLRAGGRRRPLPGVRCGRRAS